MTAVESLGRTRRRKRSRSARPATAAARLLGSTTGAKGRGDDNPPASSSASARSLAILEAVSRMGKPVSAIELSPALGLPKATVHRMLLLLEELGFLQREPGTRRFIVGDRLTKLSLEALINMPRKAERHTILQRLVDEVQETCNVTVLVGNEVAYIDRVECHWPLRTHFHIGSRVPIHCGASGKLYLSLMPAAKRSRILRSAPLKPYTDLTVLDPDLIEQELKQIRATRIGIDVEEFVHGLIGLAVPVMDSQGRICATVSMHAPTLRVTRDSVLAFVPALRCAADAFAATLEPAARTKQKPARK